MPNPAPETVDPPYTAFRFEVALTPDDPPPGVDSPVCHAAFAECDGLEMTMEPKTVREGGNNDAQPHLIGPVSYGQLTLRRGMTSNLQLWTWFLGAAQPGRRPTAEGEVTMWDAAGTPRVTFLLHGCVPVKVRGPSLNAKDGQVAVEEMHLAYASMEVRPAGDGGFGAGLGAGLSIGGGISLGGGIGVSASLDASAALSVSGGPGLSGGLSASASASLSVG
jgi:phage tail-like protein